MTTVANAPHVFTCPWVESPFFRSILRSREGSLDVLQRQLAEHYHEHGYVILDDVLDAASCERIVADVGPLFDPATTEGPRSRYRVQDAWRESAAVARLAADERILSTLRFLYERGPVPFQTLNFLTGTQQMAHADTLHFNCVPSKYLCGVWVALEDIHPDSGPLFYHPGSQRLPEFDPSDCDPRVGSAAEVYDQLVRLVGESFPRVEFTPHRGQALIWAANLWHGGAPIRDAKRTRRAQVTHYYFEDGIYYFPQNSNRALGQFELKDVVEVGTGRHVPHTLNGRALRATSIGNRRSTLSLVEGRSTSSDIPD
ncbi:MAG: phytanoyl-CoA dioxygenase family protein [Planctomycetes bacterium]|nr:phytanoyl-CoA dioxygenase family protein [Planctomycetota bacterium]MBI3844359.1 phytanoyl-CoA dioxygenase family protein [Planctomycetota bacterium]